MGNASPPHLSPNLHFNLQIKMPKRKLRSGLLNTLQGEVGPVNVRWEYDRRITDLLNPVTACLPIFCSDGLFVDRVQLSADYDCDGATAGAKLAGKE